jgi:hypothetical protein
MTFDQLKALLGKYNVPESALYILPIKVPSAYATVIVDQLPDKKYRVYYVERGEMELDSIHDSENDACRALVKILSSEKRRPDFYREAMSYWA